MAGQELPKISDRPHRKTLARRQLVHESIIMLNQKKDTPRHRHSYVFLGTFLFREPG